MQIKTLTLSLVITTALTSVSLAQSYDVVILNGRVMDPETGFDAVANVGIDNGWITAITTDAIEGYGISVDGMPGLNAEGEFLDWDAPYEDYAGHPRAAGSHALVLRLGREAVVPLMLSLSQLSHIQATRLGDTGIRAMQVHGRMQEGMAAKTGGRSKEALEEKNAN